MNPLLQIQPAQKIIFIAKIRFFVVSLLTQIESCWSIQPNTFFLPRDFINDDVFAFFSFDSPFFARRLFFVDWTRVINYRSAKSSYPLTGPLSMIELYKNLDFPFSKKIQPVPRPLSRAVGGQNFRTTPNNFLRILNYSVQDAELRVLILD